MSAVNKPIIQLVATKDLDENTLGELFEFSDRFSSRKRHRFSTQLVKDEYVFLVRGSITQHLVAFGTLSISKVEHEGEKAIIIYTGSGMISPAFRKHGIIQRVGFNAFLNQRLRHPFKKIYWMMTASTLNSYLLMVRNFEVSYPKTRVEWPGREKSYVQQVLSQIGAKWNPDTGVVERGGLSFYREGQVGHRDINSSDEDIAFYAQANPGQAEGDTLVCLTPLNFKNFLRVARRQLFRTGKKKATVVELNGLSE